MTHSLHTGIASLAESTTSEDTSRSVGRGPVSSAVERSLHMRDVAGSIPAPATTSTLTRAQRKRLAAEADEWTRRDSEWRAGRTFLDLEERGLVEWRAYHGGDVSVGPGAHGGGWLTRRTEAGRLALEALKGRKEKGE